MAAFFTGVAVPHVADAAAAAAEEGAAAEGKGEEGGGARGGAGRGVDYDWAAPAADGAFVWVPPAWRGAGAGAPSRGHFAHHAGWRANCELAPYDHALVESTICPA